MAKAEGWNHCGFFPKFDLQKYMSAQPKTEKALNMKKLLPLLIVIAIGGCRKISCRECTVIIYDANAKVHYPASKVSMCGKSKSEVKQYERDNNYSKDGITSKAVCD